MYIVKDIGPRLQTVVIVGLKEDGNKKNVAGFGLGGIGDRRPQPREWRVLEYIHLSFIVEAVFRPCDEMGMGGCL